MDTNNVDRIAGAVANAVRQSLSNALSPTTPTPTPTGSSRASSHGAASTIPSKLIESSQVIAAVLLSFTKWRTDAI